MVENYDDPNGPRWAGNFAPARAPLADELHVVTFNIEYALRIEQAIATLEDSEELARAHVLLLQEMDEGGSERIAAALGYDYVYYPGSRLEDGRNYGGAVLSVWPIVHDEKLLLPHLDPMNGRRRIAVLAVLETPRGRIGVASVHTNVPTLGPEARLDQARYVRDAAHELGLPAVVGGDFNTSDWAVDSTVAVFTQKGFEWASKGIGDTGSVHGHHFLDLDHVFSRDLPKVAAGRVDTNASDHRVVWVTLDASALPRVSDNASEDVDAP